MSDSTPTIDISPLEPVGIPVLDFAGGRFISEGLRNLLIERGRSFERDDSLVDPRWDKLPRELKMCFRNASVAALENPDELSYVEGYALSKDIPFPIMHGWLVDNNGNVVDKTWEDGHDYYGIKFSNDVLRKVMLETEQYGILDALWWNDKVGKIIGLNN